MISVKDQNRFNELKAQFGSDGQADELTLSQFAHLPDSLAFRLAERLADYPESAEVLDIRARAKKVLQAQEGKY